MGSMIDRPTSQPTDLRPLLNAIKEPWQPKDMGAENERRSMSHPVSGRQYAEGQLRPDA